MSKYTGTDDFRDLLSDRYNDNFEEFIKRTEGRIYKNTLKGSIEKITITCPADLIPYYSYVIDNNSTRDDYIVLSTDSYLDKTLQTMNELNEKFGVKGGFQPFNTDYFEMSEISLKNMHIQALKENVVSIMG